MHYPQYYTDGLPDEVVQSQSAQVQNVSGATYSTDAFKDAIQDALNQAQINMHEKNEIVYGYRCRYSG